MLATQGQTERSRQSNKQSASQPDRQTGSQAGRQAEFGAPDPGARVAYRKIGSFKKSGFAVGRHGSVSACRGSSVLKTLQEGNEQASRSPLWERAAEQGEDDNDGGVRVDDDVHEWDYEDDDDDDNDDGCSDDRGRSANTACSSPVLWSRRQPRGNSNNA